MKARRKAVYTATAWLIRIIVVYFSLFSMSVPSPAYALDPATITLYTYLTYCEFVDELIVKSMSYDDINDAWSYVVKNNTGGTETIVFDEEGGEYKGKTVHLNKATPSDIKDDYIYLLKAPCAFSLAGDMIVDMVKYGLEGWTDFLNFHTWCPPSPIWEGLCKVNPDYSWSASPWSATCEIDGTPITLSFTVYVGKPVHIKSKKWLIILYNEQYASQQIKSLGIDYFHVRAKIFEDLYIFSNLVNTKKYELLKIEHTLFDTDGDGTYDYTVPQEQEMNVEAFDDYLVWKDKRLCEVGNLKVTDGSSLVISSGPEFLLDQIEGGNPGDRVISMSWNTSQPTAMKLQISKNSNPDQVICEKNSTKYENKHVAFINELSGVGVDEELKYYIECTNNAGETVEKDGLFSISELPEISSFVSLSISNPGQGDVLHGTVVINSEVTSQYALQSVKYSINGGPYKEMFHEEENTFLAEWDTAQNSGVCNISVIAEDCYGNWKSEEISVSVDNELRLSVDLEPSSVIQGADFDITGTLKDAADVPLQNNSLSFFNGSTYLESCNTGPDGSCSVGATAPGTAGTYSIKAKAVFGGQSKEGSTQLFVTDPDTGYNLSVRDFHLDEYTVTPDGTITLYATFDNNGAYDEDLIVHWYLFDSDSDSAYRSETTNYGNLSAGGSSSGEKSVDFQVGSAEGSHTAKVWIELNNDADPSDNLSFQSFSVGNSKDYEEYQIFNRGGEIGVEYTDGNSQYTVKPIFATTEHRAKYQIKNGPDVILDLDEAYFHDSNQLVLFHQWGDADDKTVMFQMWTYPPDIDYSITPKRLVASRGQEAVFNLSTTGNLTNPRVSRITSAGEVVKNWSLHTDRVSPGLCTISLDIPLAATAKTYDFWWNIQLDGKRYAQKVELEVLPEHDISISKLVPESNVSMVQGESLEISATINSANGYTEQTLTTLTITGPNSYSYTKSVPRPVAGSEIIQFSPDWNTTGLASGAYTVTVSVSGGIDANTSNNSKSIIATLTEPPQLVVTSHVEKTDLEQGEMIEIWATVSGDGNSITDASVSAVLNWPDGTVTKPTLFYNLNESRYECEIIASRIGSYTGSVNASKSGFNDGSSGFDPISVSNAPPDTDFTMHTPSDGQWINSTSVYFAWIGSDTGTPVSSLNYSSKLDDFPWSDWGSLTNVLLTGLTQGNHTFQVKSYDGQLEDVTPAIITFSIDSMPPEISIETDGGSGPGEDFTTGEGQVIIEGIVNDSAPSSGIAGTIASKDVQDEGTSSDWRFTIPLQFGSNNLYFETVDIAGNSDRVYISITRSADSIYISTSGDDINGDGTESNPFETVDKGVNTVNVNGNLYLEGGSYIGPLNAPITILKPMTINSYGGTAIIGE